MLNLLFYVWLHFITFKGATENCTVSLSGKKKKKNSVYERHNNITGSTAVNLRGNPTVL